MGPPAQAPLRSRTLVRCVHNNRASHTRPTDHLQDTQQKGRPIPRSDRVSETLAANYHHQQRGTCILTADTARFTRSPRWRLVGRWSSPVTP
jgi:hypothetical protein